MRPTSRSGGTSARGLSGNFGGFAAAGSNLVTTPRPSTSDRGSATAKLSGARSFGSSFSSTGQSISLVRALKNTGVAQEESASLNAKASPQSFPKDSDDGSDDGRGSTCSACSNLSVMSMSSATGRKIMGERGRSDSRSSRSLHMSFDGCSVEIEAENAVKVSLLTAFEQLSSAEGGGRGDGLNQCLQMYGYETPNKLQQRVIPAIMHFMGRQLGGQAGASGTGKCCITVQGPQLTGKTSAMVIALLASINVETPMPQAIILSASTKFDIDRYLRVFTLMQSITYVSFNKEEDFSFGSEVNDRCPEIRAAMNAHIIIGRPRCVLKLLSSVPSISLDAMRVLVIDDANDMLLGTSHGQSKGGQDVELKRESFIASPVENVTDSYKIRSGQTPGLHVRHVLIVEDVKDPATKKAIRFLKNSVMKRKNNSTENSAPPTKLIRSMKHYFATAPRAAWAKVFARLMQSLMFPRALIFSDDEDIGGYFRALQGLGIAVSANAPCGGKPGDSAAEVRRRALQEFTSGKTQFLITTSEPAICQIMLPKVSCVFHFGVPSHMPSAYGVRLMPIDLKVVKDSASILLVESTEVAAMGSTPPLVQNLAKLFDINFMDMPWEFLPTSIGGSGKKTFGRHASLS